MTYQQCPYCHRKADPDGSIFHGPGCNGLDDVPMNRLQYDALAARLAEAERVIHRIANDRLEDSHSKRDWQIQDHVMWCKDYLRTSGSASASHFDCKRFECAPCYLCGYNGPNYYSSTVHACAKRYHSEVYRQMVVGLDGAAVTVSASQKQK